jgi:DNA-binding XRE family transcriptional regulator
MGKGEALDRAVASLSTVGLLWCEGDFVIPTLPARHFVNVAERFGDNLKRGRKEADLSQDELSVRASVHRTEISQLERGLRVARIDTLVKLAVSLEASPAELLEGIAWRPGEARRGRFRKANDSEAGSQER